ncbi:hypothetical protein K503DRAFT_866698 [Rhizopogon vinicolor AM-OR11-026]|uniref:Uncharacterized protein n=1 Tax=Rhizopogon vinicolor AM-OR11-026 TaxID=1314800 RepID=A0A1B7MYJ6_9AGAM|nr:hypothetical protein K503DRAFT_866698 [Rhizopogon vinicolor AM-OR11-026]
MDRRPQPPNRRMELATGGRRADYRQSSTRPRSSSVKKPDINKKSKLQKQLKAEKKKPKMDGFSDKFSNPCTTDILLHYPCYADAHALPTWMPTHYPRGCLYCYACGCPHLYYDTPLFIVVERSLSRGTDIGVLYTSTPSDMRPADHPDRSLTSNNLVDALVARFEHRGNDKHLDEAIPPRGVGLALHPGRSSSFNNLATVLTCSVHSDNDHDLEEALAITHSTLSLMMTHHPRRSIVHGSLANIYLLIHQSRLHTTGEDADSLNAAMSHFKASVLRWIHSADQYMHSTLLDAYANSIQLLDTFISTILSLVPECGGTRSSIFCDRLQSVPFAAIGHDHPTGFPFTLESVKPELESVRSLLPPTSTLKSFLHQTHKTQNFDEPFKSAFLMRDQPLTLLDVTQMNLFPHESPFPSARKTAVGDAQAPDEVIHLAAGLQFAGVKV